MTTGTHRPRGLSASHANEEERLQVIMNDKSTLSCVRLLGKENWVKMEERPNCFYCARKFRPFSIKRHCRSCGEIVCSNCYQRRRVEVSRAVEVTVRLCIDCIDKAMLLAEKEKENLGNADDVMEQLDEDDTKETIPVECKPDEKKTYRDSLRTTSTSISFDSQFSDFSSCDSSSDVDSCESARSSQRDSRSRKATATPIEFLSEERQSKIYDARRHKILAQLQVLDTEPEKEYDALCDLIRQVFECNVAAVAFMDQTRQWYKARCGIAQAELPRDIAFCSQLLQTPLPTIIMDMSQDPRFNQNPLVTGSASIRFYASAPICDPSTGIIIGSVFVMDSKVRHKLPTRAMEVLLYVSSAVEKLLQGKVDLKHKHHVSLSHPIRRGSLPPLAESRAASLQSVPEEIEDGNFLITQPRSNTSSASSNSSTRSSQRGHSRPKRTASVPDSESQYSQVSTSPVSAKSFDKSSSKLCITDLVSEEPKSITIVQAAPAQLKGLDPSCIELFRRVNSTQQLLAQQHNTLLATLTRQSSRISSIEKAVDRIESILSMQQMHMPQLVDPAGRWLVDM